jgi:IS5 family transposase
MSHYGYKNNVNVGRKHKLVRQYHFSDAALHDSQAVDHLPTQGHTGSVVWADAAYRFVEMEAKLRARQLKSHIHRQGNSGKPLTEQGKGSSRTKSTVRLRIEHIFGAQTNDMGGTLVRSTGLVRAKANVEIKNLVYNMRRIVQLSRLNPCPA